MPQVSDNFGPIYQNVVLDGSGYGYVSFQAVGSNVRLTNIFFRVSTATSQAVCSIYKGQIADGNRVLNSNSGSTGANANGNVDLFDGETCYVVWTGGDPGATATATFTGGKLPLGGVRPSSLEASEPFAAGDGSIIFPALKSPNFVAGVSGWRLDRDGNIELNDAVVRGDLDVPAGNGGYVRIENNNGFASISMMPDPALPEIEGIIDVQNAGSPGPFLAAYMTLSSPRPNADVAPANIILFSDTADGVTIRSAASINAYDVNIGDYDDGRTIINNKFSRPNATISFGTPNIPTGGAGATMISGTAVTGNNVYGMVSGGGFVAVKAGFYDVTLSTQFAAQAASAGFRQHYIFVNGVEIVQNRVNASVNFNNAPVMVNTTHPLELAIGDTVTFGCYQTSGGNLALTAASRASINLREG